jgi:hypothetical protein
VRVIRVARAMRLSGIFFTAPPRRVFVCISETHSLPYTDCVCHPFWQRPSDARRSSRPPATLSQREKFRVYLLWRDGRADGGKCAPDFLIFLLEAEPPTQNFAVFARRVFYSPRSREPGSCFRAFRTRNVTVSRRQRIDSAHLALKICELRRLLDDGGKNTRQLQNMSTQLPAERFFCFFK